MSGKYAFISIAALLLLIACHSPSLGKGDRGIGDPCRRNSDCIDGATCKFATCDFVAPCRSTQGDEVTVFAFDAQGRELGSTRTLDGKVMMRQVVTWSDDGRTSSWQMWESDDPGAKPDLTWTETYDEAGDMTHSVESYRDGTSSETRYTWSDDWACRAWVAEVPTAKGANVSRGTCDDAGNPIRYESRKDGKLVATREYTYVAGRMATRVMTLTDVEMPPRRMAVVRDARGAIDGIRHDYDDDGILETRETYDLSCWEVTGDRVVYKKP